MPSYAILTATGNAGVSVLKVLLQEPSAEINVLVRSKAKLLRQNLTIDPNPAVATYEGNISDITTLSVCMAGTRAVFLTVAVVDNVPGCSIALDTAHSVVSALQMLRDTNADARLPKLIVLSSQSLDDHLCLNMPKFVHWVATTAFSNIYQDLRNAEAYLRLNGDWLSATFIKPGGLSSDVQNGHMISTDPPNEQAFLSFLDLAAGMVEVADTEGDMWDMKNVIVQPVGDGAKFEWRALVWMIKGLFLHFIPGLYPWLKA